MDRIESIERRNTIEKAFADEQQFNVSIFFLFQIFQFYS